MRIVRRREDEDTKRLISTLRRQIEDAKAEARVQTDTAVRLARQISRDGVVAGARAALAEPYRQTQDENERLRAEIRRLRARLDDALGRTPEDRAAIEAGTGEPIRRASA